MSKDRVYRCDCDGYLSSTIIYTFLKNNYEIPILFFHNAKQHGLRKNEDEDIVQQIIDSKINLLIIPDAGTNDFQEQKELISNGISIIVLDHHEVDDYDKVIESSAYIVNHHLGRNLNTALSGTGVTYKFVEAYCEKYNLKMAEYRDLIMFSLISDECDLSSYENYSFLKAGYKILNSGKGNQFLKYLTDKVSNQQNCAKKFSFRVIPMFNSVIRSANMQNKLILFQALVDEFDAEEAYKIGSKEQRQQKKIVDEIIEEVQSTIDFSKKVLIGFTKPKYKSYIGLAANKFTGEYNKPTIILREAGNTKWSGSLRSPVPLAEKINETNLAKCLGHSSAAGCFLKKSNLPKLQDYFEKLDLNEESVYIVAGKLEPYQINNDLCCVCDESNSQWGCSKGNRIVIPKFYFNLKLNSYMFSIIGKKNDTLKFNIDNVNFIKFRLSEEEIEQLKQYNEFNFECIGVLTNNEYNGTITSQVIIEKFEVTETKQDWNELF